MQDRDIKDTSAKRQDDVFLSGLLSGVSRQREMVIQLMGFYRNFVQIDNG
jgi:hypothetical protein